MSIFSLLFGPPDGGPLPYTANSPEGLASRWIRWVAASNRKASPISDPTGRYAGHNQPKDVWFLAGCFGGSVKRTCIIPANKMIFFPAFNIWFLAAKKPPYKKEMPKAFGYLRIDGINTPLNVIFTPQPFLVKGVTGNPVTGTPQRKSVVVWGLWRLVSPLTPGNHEICFGGGDGHGFQVDATYEVRIERQ